jgi:hypothetical protein
MSQANRLVEGFVGNCEDVDPRRYVGALLLELDFALRGMVDEQYVSAPMAAYKVVSLVGKLDCVVLTFIEKFDERGAYERAKKALKSEIVLAFKAIPNPKSWLEDAIKFKDKLLDRTAWSLLSELTSMSVVIATGKLYGYDVRDFESGMIECEKWLKVNREVFVDAKFYLWCLLSSVRPYADEEYVCFWGDVERAKMLFKSFAPELYPLVQV